MSAIRLICRLIGDPDATFDGDLVYCRKCSQCGRRVTVARDTLDSAAGRPFEVWCTPCHHRAPGPKRILTVHQANALRFPCRVATDAHHDRHYRYRREGGVQVQVGLTVDVEQDLLPVGFGLAPPAWHASAILSDVDAPEGDPPRPLLRWERAKVHLAMQSVVAILAGVGEPGTETWYPALEALHLFRRPNAWERAELAGAMEPGEGPATPWSH